MFRQNKDRNEHENIEARLSAYLDNQLSAEEHARVQAHLQSCDSCRADLSALRWTVSLVKQAPAPALPRQFTLPVTRLTLPVAPRAHWLRWGLSAGAVVAAAAFVVLLTSNLLKSSPGNLAAIQPAAPQPPTSIALQATGAPAQPKTGDAVIGTIAPFATIAVPPTAATAPTQTAPEAVPATDQANESKSAFPASTVVGIAPANRTTSGSGQPPLPCDNCGGGPPFAAETPSVQNAPAAAAAAPLPTGRVNVGTVYVRVSPSKTAKAITSVHRNEILQVFGRTALGDWLLISVNRDQQVVQGWIDARYLTLNGRLDKLPVIDTSGQGEFEIPSTTEPATPTDTETATP